MKKIFATVAAAAVASGLAAAPTPAVAKAKNCGVVSKNGHKLQFYRERGKVSCRTVRYVGSRARLYGGGMSPRGFSCWHTGAIDQERGLLGGCAKGRARFSIWVPGRR